MGAVRSAFAVVLCAWLAFPIFDLDATRLSGTDRVAFVGLALTAASLAAIPLGLLVAALAQPGGRRLSRTALAISLGLLLAWIVLGVLFVLSWGLVLFEPAIVLGTLGVGLLAGLFFASPPPRGAAHWFGGFAAGLGIAALLAAAPGWLFLFFTMTIPLLDFETSSAFAAPLLHAAGWIGAELSWWFTGREPLAIGVGFGTIGFSTLTHL